MSEQAVLDMLRLQRLLQQRVALKINHPESQVITCSPIGMRLSQFLFTQRRSYNGGPRRAVSTERGSCWLDCFCKRCHFFTLLVSLESYGPSSRLEPLFPYGFFCTLDCLWFAIFVPR